MSIPIKGISSRVRALTAAITDLPRIEDLPSLPAELASRSPRDAESFHDEQKIWYRQFVDALQRLLRDESFDFNELLRRIEAVEARPVTPQTECPECPEVLRVRAGVGRWDLVDHARPHGIRDVGESADGWKVELTGLLAGDTYQLQLEYDNAAIEDPVFIATSDSYTLSGLYPSGASKIVRVEFAIYPLPVAIIPRAYRGRGARADGTEFYNIMEDLAP